MNPEPTHQPHPHNNHNQQAPSMHALSTETTNPYSRIRLFFDAHKTQLWAAIISGILVLVISCLVLSTLVVYHHGKDGSSWDFRPLISSITFSAIAWISMKYRQNRILKSAAGQDSNIETTSALSLFETIALWTLLSLTAYTLLAAIWGEGAVSERLFSGWRIKSSPEITPLERIKTTLTTVGGIGGVSFLVIKFRQQDIAEKQHKHSEEERIKAEEAEISRKFEAEKLEANKKLVDAVQQLGDQSPQVRIAGVYALADVAGTYGSENHGVDYNKRAVEILCGYLRTVRSEDDKPVESAVLSILSSHLTPSTNSLHNNISPWSRYTIDLRGAKLTEAVNFDFAQISRLDCHATEFFGEVSLEECQLGNASFQDAIFEKTTNFKKASFMEANFSGANFKQKAEFGAASTGKIEGASFEGNANFKNTRFEESAIFNHSSFDKVDFQRSLFMGNALFQNVNFAGRANFGNRTIFKNKAHFNGSTFDAARFKDAIFEGHVNFGRYDKSRTTFVNTGNFSGARFDKKVTFQCALFYGEAKFYKTIFKDEVNFQGGNRNESATTFKGKAYFCSTNFRKYANFKNVVFESEVSFDTYRNNPTIFEEGVGFQEANFTRCDYHYCIFKKRADWRGAVVTSSNFRHALFNIKLAKKGRIVFSKHTEVGSNGLPEGAEWAEFEPTEHLTPVKSREQNRPQLSNTSRKHEHYYGDYPL